MITDMDSSVASSDRDRGGHSCFRSDKRAFMAVHRPLAGVVPGWAVVETMGRRTGRPRQTPVGGRLSRGTFWLVVGERSRSQYVKNIEANPTVRIRASDVGTPELLTCWSMTTLASGS